MKPFGLGILMFAIAMLAQAAGDDFGLLRQTEAVSNPAEKTPEVRAELLADTAAIEPGKPFRLGVRFGMAPGWHIYGPETGDLGLPTKIEWELPEGFRAGPLQWPVPVRFEDQGEFSLGYTGEVLVFATVTPPGGAAPGGGSGASFSLKAKASWLVCKDACIPGDAKVELKLPSGKAAPSKEAGEFDQAAARVMPEGGSGSPAQAGLNNTESGKTANPPAEAGGKNEPAGSRLSDAPGDQAPGQSPLAAEPQDRLKAGQPNSESGAGDRDRQKAGQLSSDVAGRAKAGQPNAEGQVFSFYQGDEARLPLWKIFLFAFLGGMILNVMPCVLPVLSLKVLGFVRQAGESRGRSFRLGLAYTVGVLASFAALAGVVVALQTAGRQVGQGFQLQDPRFVAVMTGVIFAVSLSLFGVFTIELPGTAVNQMDRIGRREGYGGALLSGVLATALATPCSAPLLGPVLAFAFSQPPRMVMAVFLVWGFGLAAPYLALAANPGWLRWVPRPGRWMLVFEQAMGFVMLGFAVWLLGVLGVQAGAGAVVGTLAFLLAVGVACWLVGLAERFGWSRRKWAASLLAGAGLVAAGYLLFPERYLRDLNTAPGAVAAPKAAHAGVIPWEPFSVGRVEELVRQGRTVFVDFTAEWCWTCKTNERRVLETEQVRSLFDRHGVAPLKADWTARDETIGRVLRQFGSAGVPLYVVFPAGQADQPKVLPTLLTFETIKRALP